MRITILAAAALLIGCKPVSQARSASELGGPLPRVTVSAPATRVHGACETGDSAMVLRLPRETGGLARMPKDTGGSAVPIPNACAASAASTPEGQLPKR
jgi:hypothetical protein